MSEHFINNETVHNWTNRWRDKPYFADLSDAAKLAIQRAHDRHHGEGTNCKDEAERLCERFPNELVYG